MLHIYTCTYIYIYIYVCINIFIYIYIRVYILYICICMYVCIYTCIHVYIFICIYINGYIYAYTYITLTPAICARPVNHISIHTHLRKHQVCKRIYVHKRRFTKLNGCWHSHMYRRIFTSISNIITHTSQT